MKDNWLPFSNKDSLFNFKIFCQYLQICCISQLSTKRSWQTSIADLHDMSNQRDAFQCVLHILFYSLCVSWQYEQFEHPALFSERKGAVNIPKDMSAIRTDSTPSIIHATPVSSDLHHCLLKLLLAVCVRVHCKQKFPLNITSLSEWNVFLL